MKKKLIFFLIITLFISFLLNSEIRNLSLFLSPDAFIPLGDSADTYNLGFGIDLTGEYRLASLPALYIHSGLSFKSLSTTMDTNLTIAGLELGPGAIFNLTDIISFKLFGFGGGYAGMYEGENAFDLFYGAGSHLIFSFNPGFSLGVGGAYKNFYAVDVSDTLVEGLSVSIGTLFTFGTKDEKSNIDIKDIIINPIFPIFYKYYDDKSFGQLKIQNNEAGMIKDVKVSFFINKYMDVPKQCALIEDIKAGGTKEVPVLALLNSEILKITEATKVPAEIKIEYSYYGKKKTMDLTQTVRLYDRNAMTWDDDRKAAAFVTAKDPQILRVSKIIAGVVRNNEKTALNNNFKLALAMFQSLSLYKINYVVDPKTPFKDFSKNKLSIDYLQFPIQTMIYKAGDCDDLSILYCALLESVGVETAFITVPGHIYVAFSLDMPPAEARRLFTNSNDLIYENDKTWIPVEITMINNGFIGAWQEGAKEWRENITKNNSSKLYPIHKAWEEYEPVDSPKIEGNIIPLKEAAINAMFIKEMDKFVKREIDPKIAEINKEIIRSKYNPRVVNRLGILYAMYGQYAEAEKTFNSIILKENYAPAYVNLGNIKLVKKEAEKALEYYNKAYKADPANHLALVGITKANVELEKYGEAKIAFKKLEKENPDLAGKISYLIDSSGTVERAGVTDTQEGLLWNE